MSLPPARRFNTVGSAYLPHSLTADYLVIDLDDESERLISPIAQVRAMLRQGTRASVSRRYESDDPRGPCMNVPVSITLSLSPALRAVTFAIEGRVYAILTHSLKEVLDGVAVTARIVERVDLPVLLSDADGRQATLGAF